MRTFNFPLVNTFDEGDVLLKDGINGTKTILAADAIPSNSDLIQEGSTNQYYTDARVSAAPSVTKLGTFRMANLLCSSTAPNYTSATKVFSFNADASLGCRLFYGDESYVIPTGTTVTTMPTTFKNPLTWDGITFQCLIPIA